MGLQETILHKVLPRIQEIFEARNPKGQAVITEIDGEVTDINEGRDRQHEIVVQGEVETTYLYMLHILHV